MAFVLPARPNQVTYRVQWGAKRWERENFPRWGDGCTDPTMRIPT